MDGHRVGLEEIVLEPLGQPQTLNVGLEVVVAGDLGLGVPSTVSLPRKMTLTDGGEVYEIWAGDQGLGVPSTAVTSNKDDSSFWEGANEDEDRDILAPPAEATLDTFTCFPELPLEMRREIWKYVDACQEPRKLWLWRQGSLFLQGEQNNKALYPINLESRGEFHFLNRYLRLKDEDGCVKEVLFNFKVDLIVLVHGDWDWMSTINDMCLDEDNKEQLKKIKRVAIHYVANVDYEDFSARGELQMEKAYRAFPNLVEVTLYLEDCSLEFPGGWYEVPDAYAVWPANKKAFVGLYKKVISECFGHGMWAEKPAIRALKPWSAVGGVFVEPEW